MSVLQRLFVLTFACAIVVGTLALLVRAPAVFGQTGSTGGSAPWRAHLGEARLVGEATLRWMGLRVYDARLFAPIASMSPEQLFEQPFALELSYGVSLRGGRIADRSIEEIAQLGLGAGDERSRWHARMQSMFPDVQAADRLTGVYHPIRGARFYHNERFAGEIADPAFARAFFSIWLDERTSVPALRRDLLRGIAPATAGSGR